MNYPYSEPLRQLMEQVNISSLRQLSRTAGVSERQILRLRQGKVQKMQLETLLKLSTALNISLNRLLAIFSGETIIPEVESNNQVLEQEYQRLQAKLEQQRITIEQEFQNSSLQAIESWLLQWQTAAYMARSNPKLPAIKLLPLVKPIEKLVQQWGVETIASVGEQIPYNPQWHQLLEGEVKPGEMVQVRYVGYCQGDKLLHRAKVSRIISNE